MTLLTVPPFDTVSAAGVANQEGATDARGWPGDRHVTLAPASMETSCAPTEEQTEEPIRTSATAVLLRLPQARVISETATQAPRDAFQMLRCVVSSWWSHQVAGYCC